MINIVLITDNVYVIETIVTITSIIQNKKPETLLNINILTNGLNKENIELLESLGANNVKINIIDATDKVSQFKNVASKGHITYTALLKFFIPKIFKDLDKILYFDSDIIIQNDLSEFFEHNLENIYAEVVMDILSYDKRYLKNLNLSGKKYFNSGILLLNLKKMREDNITEKLIDYKLNFCAYGFMDQDSLNVILKEKLKYTSYKYNFLTFLFDRMPIKQLGEFYNEEIPDNIEDVLKSCTVLHFAGIKKPWIYQIEYLSDIYRKYWELSPITEPFPDLLPLPENNCKHKYNLFEQIFSIKVDDSLMYKILTILGLKFRFRRYNKQK